VILLDVNLLVYAYVTTFVSMREHARGSVTA
jgi:hypothetical protein